MSLSGLSGVFAGVYALIGAYFVYADLGLSSTREAMLSYGDWIMRRGTDPTTAQKINEMVVVGVTVLVLSIMTGYYFSRRKAKKNNLKMWDKSAKLMVMNLAIPLVSGGVILLNSSFSWRSVFGGSGDIDILWYCFGSIAQSIRCMT